jgi:hypothetical protein
VWSCISSEVDQTSALAVAAKRKIALSTITRVVNKGPVRHATAAYLENLLFPSGASASVVAPAESTPAIDELATLLEVRSMIVELRAMLAPLIAERAAEVAA